MFSITSLQFSFTQVQFWIQASKVLVFLEACFDLISSSSLSMKIQIMDRKITENLGFKSPLWKVKIFLFLFFSFQILMISVDPSKDFSLKLQKLYLDDFLSYHLPTIYKHSISNHTSFLMFIHSQHFPNLSQLSVSEQQ